MLYQLNNNYYVRPLNEGDLNGSYMTWFQDQEVCRYNSHGKFHKTREYFEDYIRGLNTEDSIVWAICHTKDNHIGNISLQQISFINRTAEFSIILGDKEHWGKGVGFLAGKKLFYHGFIKLNLMRIGCGTAATNEGMKKLATSLGMQQEGVRRKQLFLDGERVDVIEYGILREEFNPD